MLGALILHPAQWLQVLSASGASLLALAITSALALNASEEENVSVLPVLPWLAASLGVVLAAVGALGAQTSLMTIALWIALATVALWLALIIVAASLAMRDRGGYETR